MDAATSLSAPDDGFRLRWRLTPLRLVGLLTMVALAVRLIGAGRDDTVVASARLLTAETVLVVLSGLGLAFGRRRPPSA